MGCCSSTKKPATIQPLPEKKETEAKETINPEYALRDSTLETTKKEALQN